MQLTKESVTAMPLPISMSIRVLMQGKKLSGFVAAITSFGEAGVLGYRMPKLLPLLQIPNNTLNKEQHILPLRVL